MSEYFCYDQKATQPFGVEYACDCRACYKKRVWAISGSWGWFAPTLSKWQPPWRVSLLWDYWYPPGLWYHQEVGACLQIIASGSQLHLSSWSKALLETIPRFHKQNLCGRWLTQSVIHKAYELPNRKMLHVAAAWRTPKLQCTTRGKHFLIIDVTEAILRLPLQGGGSLDDAEFSSSALEKKM